MTTIPTGSPAWLRTAEITQYGGDVNKQNYLSQGVIDAQTDVGAEDFCRITADEAAVTRTSEFATIVYLCNDSSPAAPTIETAYMMTGVRLTSYAGGAPPSGFPSAARNGNGDVTFTFASSYADEYGVSGAFEIRTATACGHGSTFVLPVVEKLSATTVRVRCFFHDGTAVSDARVTLTIG